MIPQWSRNASAFSKKADLGGAVAGAVDERGGVMS